MSHGTSHLQIAEVAGFDALFDAQINVVVLDRVLDPQARAEAHSALDSPGFRVTVSVPPTPSGLRELERQLDGRQKLAEDVHFWVEVLTELTGCEHVGVRLTRVDTATCPRLHVDKVAVRLVSAYVGAGTEYVANEDLDRRWLGHAALGKSDEHSGLLRSDARIRAAKVSQIVLLKGETWPDNAGRGAVHRSPAACAGTPRLVMTLDPLD